MTPPTPPTTHPPATTGADAAELAKLLREARAKADSASAYHAMLTPFNALRIADTLEAQARELAAARASLAACRAALRKAGHAAWRLSACTRDVNEGEAARALANELAALADADRAGAEGG
jgi:hypothetical protein